MAPSVTFAASTKSKKKIFLWLFSSQLAICSYGQSIPVPPSQTIHGVVIDDASHHPMPYVTLQLITHPEIGAVTDSLSRFSLKQVPVGRPSLRATYVGYKPRAIHQVLVTSAKEVYLEVALRKSLNQLDEVVVRAHENRDEAINKMALAGDRMLSIEEASRYAGGFDDPARLVSSFAGVVPSVSNNGISIHGNAPTSCSGVSKR